jgi:hypothetical protein
MESSHTAQRHAAWNKGGRLPAQLLPFVVAAESSG